MQFFNVADWLVIIGYLLGIIGLGVWFGRDQRNTRDYFLGSKNTPWWGIGLSIVAAETSALTIISVPAMAFGDNISFIQIIVGYVIARILLAVIMVPHYLKGEIYSPYQLLESAFGPSARKLSGGFFLISETLAAGVRVYVASIPIKLIFGDKVLSLGTGDPILGAILLFVLLSLVYTYIGGVKAVIWTDAVQFGLFMLGGVFALCYIPSLIEGGTSAVFTQHAIQYLDGGDRWHIRGAFLTRCRAINRSTRAGLQECGRWPQGAGPECRLHFSFVPRVPAGRRFLMGLLPADCHGRPDPGSAPRLRH